MTSPFNSRERVTARSVVSGIFPVGRPVVVRIPQSGNIAAKPAVTLRYFPSAATSSSQAGSGQDRDGFPSLRLGRPFAGLTSRQLPRMTRSKPQCALLGSPIFPETGGTFHRGALNFFGPFEAARRFFRMPLKFCQEPRGRFTQSFKSFSSACLHVPKHGASDVEKIRFQSGDFRNVVR